MPSSRGLDWPLIAAVAAAVILVTPLWLVASPGMPDYPAHLASFYLIGSGPSPFYRVEWAFLPNLASEAIVPLLAKIMPLGIAAKLFLTVTVALWALGPAAIQRALFGKVGPGTVLAAVFAYNANFMWGFFNYSFAAGLSFFVFAAWIATNGKRTLWHLVGFAVASLAIYFAHIFALATLLLLIGCYELSVSWEGGTVTPRAIAARFAPLVLLCLLPAFAFLFLKPASAGTLALQFNLVSTMAERFEAAVQFSFDHPAYAVTGALIALLFLGIAMRRIVIAKQMYLPLAALLLCTLLAPEWALGGWAVHFRLPAVLGAVIFASVDFRTTEKWTAAAIVVGIGFCLLVATTLTLDWRVFDRRYSEFRADARDIKQQSRLLTVLDGDSLGYAADQPYWHMAEFAVIDRTAFTPLMFTTRGQHVIRVNSPFDRYAAAAAQQGSPPDVDELEDLATGNMNADEDYLTVFPYLEFFQCHFNQAVVIHGAGPWTRIPPMLRLRRAGSFYALYDIVPDKRCAIR